MPTYVYGCRNPEHPRLEKIHKIDEDYEIYCTECDEPMHRIPQLMTWYREPGGVLLDYMDDKYRDWRIRNANKQRARKDR